MIYIDLGQVTAPLEFQKDRKETVIAVESEDPLQRLLMKCF